MYVRAISQPRYYWLWQLDRIKRRHILIATWKYLIRAASSACSVLATECVHVISSECVVSILAFHAACVKPRDLWATIWNAVTRRVVIQVLIWACVLHGLAG